MRLSNEHMMTHDIDWFCCINGRYCIHLASNGSILPDFAADRKQLAAIQQYVAILPNISEGELRDNKRHLEELSSLKDYEESRYMQSFRFFAQKGFYSFDYEWENGSEGQYRLLVAPQCPISPDELRNIPQIHIEELDDKNRDVFMDIVQQIRDFE